MPTLHEKPQLHVEYLAVSALKPDPNNPRKHSPKQIDALARAMDEFGFANPILIDGDDNVIAGHGRLEAAKLQGLDTVPTIRLEHLTPAQVKAYRIADNRLAELAEWDEDALKLEFKLLSELDANLDLSLTGFAMPKIDMLLNPVSSGLEEEEEFDDQVDDGPAVTQAGDIWVLGEHRIICGDSLKPETYKKLLEGEKADLVFTDPPYNVPISGHVLTGKGKSHEEFAMASGEMSEEEFGDFLETVVARLRENARDGSIHYICMDWRHLLPLLQAGKAYDELKNICVWNKSNGGMGSLYRSKHEMVAVFKHGTVSHVNNIELGKHGRYRTNVWDYAGQTSIASKADDELAMHPTPKPVAMIADALLDCSEIGDVVLDVFGGSGSTLMAAEKVQRKARLIEIEPGYVDVTVRRWQQATGQQATLLSTGKIFDEVAANREVVHA